MSDLPPSLRPRPCVTLFHAFILMLAACIAFVALVLVGYLLSIFRHIHILHQHLPSWSIVIVYVVLFVPSLLGAFYLICFWSYWLWTHTRNFRIWYEASCYMLTALRDPSFVEERLDQIFPRTSDHPH